MARQKNDVTTRLLDITQFRSLVSTMDDTMDWLSSIGESQKVFSDMLVDARIESLVNNRKDRVLQLNAAQGKAESAAVDAACKKLLGFDVLSKAERILLNAIPFGIAACEVLWKFEGGLYIPYDFVPIPRQAISFPGFGGDYSVPYLANGETRLDNKYHFLIHKNDCGDGNRWGTPVLKSAYWPWKFKKLGFKFWIMAAERIGVPSVLALFECKTEAETKKRAEDLASILTSVESGSSGALGNVREVKVLESTIQDFETIVSVCNTEIAYAITGQSLATNEAQYGTRAQADVHETTYSDTCSGDAYLLQSTLQQLFDVFVDVNFPGESSPKFDIDSTEYAPWTVTKEAIDRGVPVSLSALYKNHRIVEPVDEKDIFVKEAGGFNFADDFFLPNRSVSRQPVKRKN